jgi:hypothetical protein
LLVCFAAVVSGMFSKLWGKKWNSGVCQSKGRYLNIWQMIPEKGNKTGL